MKEQSRNGQLRIIISDISGTYAVGANGERTELIAKMKTPEKILVNPKLGLPSKPLTHGRG